MTLFKKSLLAAGVMACASATATAAGNAPTLGDVLTASGLTFNGYIDTSYSYLTGSGVFAGTTTSDRVYDAQHNAFSLHTIDLSGAYLPTNGFGGQVQLDYGTDAAVTSSGTGLPAVSGGSEVDVQQAYMQYATGPFTVMGGKFDTLAGEEVITSTADYNFSRGILFGYAIPFSHTGVRTSYAINPNYKVIVGVNNGWNTVKPSATTTPVYNKTVELGFAATPLKPLSINVSFYGGDAPGATVNHERDLLDLVASYSATNALTVALEGDYGQQKDAQIIGTTSKWNGVALFANYNLSSLWRVAGRVEYFDDKNGFTTGVIQKWKEGTVTLAFMPTVHTELRGEVRYDKSDVASFGMLSGAPKDNQSSVGLEALYKF